MNGVCTMVWIGMAAKRYRERNKRNKKRRVSGTVEAKVEKEKRRKKQVSSQNLEKMEKERIENETRQPSRAASKRGEAKDEKPV